MLPEYSCSTESACWAARTCSGGTCCARARSLSSVNVARTRSAAARARACASSPPHPASSSTTTPAASRACMRSHDLVERVLDDPDGALLHQARDELSHLRLADDALDGKPLDAVQLPAWVQRRDRGRGQARQHVDHPLELLAGNVELDPHLTLRGERPLQEHADLLELRA